MKILKILSMLLIAVVFGMTATSCSKEEKEQEIQEVVKQTTVTFKNGMDTSVRDLEVFYVNSSGERVRSEAAGDVAPGASKVFNTKGYAKVYFAFEMSGKSFVTSDVDVTVDENVTYTLTGSSYVYTRN